jgi:hypothetical protein
VSGLAIVRFATDEDGRDILETSRWTGEWPPPETLNRAGLSFRRVRMSKIEPGSMPHVAPGALYVLTAEATS